MKWFREIAPIRTKMAVISVAMTGLAATGAVGAALATARWGVPVGLVAGLVPMTLAFALGQRFRGMICDPYVTTVERMEALAAGDLDSAILHTGHRDCVGRLTKAMFVFRDAARTQGEQMVTLRQLVEAVGTSATTIQVGSDEIAQATADLARRTESSAASLGNAAEAVTLMDCRLKASAEAAGRTVVRADQAIATVGGGRALAHEAVQAMGRVSDSAKGIDSVIEGLDKIAFQTRVLAMNAAVEAGRAGDAGRGFAVVADLVSALAMRAEEEAKRARDQLELTQTDIDAAVGTVHKVDGALSDISGDVTQVHALLATMANDNQAQSVAVTQISAAIGNMDRATQQNAAMVEQTSAAARSLTAEVAGLSDRAGRLNTGCQSEAAALRVRPAPTDSVATKFVGKTRDLPARVVPALVPKAMAGGDWKAF